MPNHVTNIIEIENLSSENISKILEEIKNDEVGIGSIDFNKIIPMPDYIFRGNLGQEEREEHGVNNWYDWSIENWDTKWNAYKFEKYDGGNKIIFQTAWSAPHAVIHGMSEKYPEITMTHSWADENIGDNVGKITYENGVAIDELYLENYSKEAYDMAADIIQVDLADCGYVLNEDGTAYECNEELCGGDMSL